MRYNSTMEPLPQTEEILERVAGGEALRTVCVELGTSPQAFLRRVADNTALADQYARARTACGDMMDSRVQSVADDCAAGKIEPNAARVAIDAYKWRAAHLQPRRYGERLELDARVEHSAGAEILAALRQRRGAEIEEPPAIEAGQSKDY
jgi:hypothetical protein